MLTTHREHFKCERQSLFELGGGGAFRDRPPVDSDRRPELLEHNMPKEVNVPVLTPETVPDTADIVDTV